MAVAGCDSDSGEGSQSTSVSVASTSPTTLAAPDSPAPPDTAWLPPEAIDCTTTHQPSTSAFQQDTQVVSVQRTTSLFGDAAELTLGAFVFSVRYYGDAPEGNQLLVTVGQADNTTGSASQSYYSTTEPMTASVYGFTGMHRVEVGGSQLTWWCEVA